jgi:hypothetical protein
MNTMNVISAPPMDPKVEEAITSFECSKDRLLRSMRAAAKVADKWYTALDSIAEFDGLGMTPEEQIDAIRRIARQAL